MLKNKYLGTILSLLSGCIYSGLKKNRNKLKKNNTSCVCCSGKYFSIDINMTQSCWIDTSCVLKKSKKKLIRRWVKLFGWYWHLGRYGRQLLCLMIAIHFYGPLWMPSSINICKQQICGMTWESHNAGTYAFRD